jgi:hypothetical protein
VYLDGNQYQRLFDNIELIAIHCASKYFESEREAQIVVVVFIFLNYVFVFFFQTLL